MKHVNLVQAHLCLTGSDEIEVRAREARHMPFHFDAATSRLSAGPFLVCATQIRTRSFDCQLDLASCRVVVVIRADEYNLYSGEPVRFSTYVKSGLE